MWKVQVISAPGPDTDLCLYVEFDNARFLFGAGEGTQRAFVQKRKSMRWLQAIFISGGGLKGRGGLPGLIMSASDASANRALTIAGPPDLGQHLATVRSSVIRDSLSLDVRSFPRSSSSPSEIMYESKNMTVHAVALRPQTSEAASPSFSIAPAARPSELDPRKLEEYITAVLGDMFRGNAADRPKPAKRLFPDQIRLCLPDDRYPLPLVSDADVATDMVYICRTPDVRGKFDVARADALGVPGGRVRGQLTRGESIEVQDATAPGGMRIVRPQDCLVGGGPGSVLIVVNCCKDNVDNLLASTVFGAHQMNGASSPEVPVHLIIHRVPCSVWRNHRYQAWLASFGPKAQHLWADDETSTNEMFFNSATWNTLWLHLLDPNVFPVPHHVSPAPGALPPPPMPPNSEVLRPNHSVKMYQPTAPEILPNHEKDRPFPTSDEGLEEALAQLEIENPEYAAAIVIARAKVAEHMKRIEDVPSAPGDDIVVTTLGTGSAIPSKYRNVSSTHLDIPGLGGVLLDAGEGTLGQLRRRFGPELPQVYEDLRLVFISHMHADHHLGLASVLADRFKHGITSRIYLIGPHPIALQLMETACWQAGVPREALDNLKFISNRRLKQSVEAGSGKKDTPAEDAEQARGFDPCVHGANGCVSATTAEAPAGAAVGHAPDDAAASKAAAASVVAPGNAASDVPPPSDSYKLAAFDRSVSPFDLEGIHAQDLAAGKRRWPFENVFRFAPATNERAWATIDELMQDLGLKSLQVPSVAHRGAAFGLVLEGMEGWKVVYSGDTKPCHNLVQAGKGATVLIHEATLEDEKTEMAETKGHSTFGQAIDVGKQMGAKYIILNHFSQRYAKMPNLATPEETSDGAVAPVVAISFDFMSLRARDAWKLAYYMEPVGILYADEDEAADLDEAGAENEPQDGQTGKGAKTGKGGPKGAQGGVEKGQKGGKSQQYTPKPVKRASEASGDEKEIKKLRLPDEPADEA